MEAEDLREPYETQLHAMHLASPAWAEGRLDMREARGMQQILRQLGEKKREEGLGREGECR
jgi:hypothetical protein